MDRVRIHDAFSPQMLHRSIRGTHQNRGHPITKHAVDLLWHSPVVGTQPRFHMDNGNAHCRSGPRSSEG